MLYIPVILGTARVGRESEKVARFLLKEAVDFGFKSDLIDTRDYPVAFTGQDILGLKGLGQKIASADGFIIVSPEYNRGYPGELKHLLDSFHDEYKRKPVAICGVSSGQTGGARAVEQLRLVAIGLEMAPIKNTLLFPFITNAFSQDGTPQDATFKEKAQAMCAELSLQAEVLRNGAR